MYREANRKSQEMISFVKLSEKKEMFLCIVSSLISVYSFGKLAVLQIRGGTEDNSVIIFLIVTQVGGGGL